MKKYNDGGNVSSDGKADYAKDVVDFVLRNQSPASTGKIKDVKMKDVPGLAKEVAATAAGTVALPFADIASAVKNTGSAALKKLKGDKDKPDSTGMRKGGSVKASSASRRADGCAQRGKTKGRMV